MKKEENKNYIRNTSKMLASIKQEINNIINDCNDIEELKKRKNTRNNYPDWWICALRASKNKNSRRTSLDLLFLISLLMVFLGLFYMPIAFHYDNLLGQFSIVLWIGNMLLALLSLYLGDKFVFDSIVNKIKVLEQNEFNLEEQKKRLEDNRKACNLYLKR